jgi:hypothetical protein
MVRAAGLKWQTVALVGIVAAGLSFDASARGVRVDSGNNFNTPLGSLYDVTPITPNASPPPASITPVNLLDFPANIGGFDLPDGTLGFSVNFGEGLVSDLNIYQNGYLSFGTAIVQPGLDTTGPVDTVVAPFYVSETTVPSDMSYAKGLVDRSAVTTGNVANAVKTFRVSWTVADFPFQVVLFDMSGATGVAGDFDMEINFGSDFFDTTPPLSDLFGAGFLLGTNAFNFPQTADAFVPTTDYLFSFRNGVLSGTTPPTTVPEPDSLTLIAAGLVLLLGRAMVRRRAPQLSR